MFLLTFNFLAAYLLNVCLSKFSLKYLRVYINKIIFCFLSGDRARRSPRKLPTAMKEERKRWVMPKFLPHKYDVKLINEDKVIILLPEMRRCSKMFFASHKYNFKCHLVTRESILPMFFCVIIRISVCN